MWDEKSIYPRIESDYAFRKGMNEELADKYKNQSLTQGSAILTVRECNPSNLMVQNLSIKERVIKIEINRMRNGYITETFTSVDIQEIVKLGGVVFENFEGVFYRKNYKVSPFRSVIDKFFGFRQKYKDKNNDVIQLLVKLQMNCLYGEQIRRDIEEGFA